MEKRNRQVQGRETHIHTQTHTHAQLTELSIVTAGWNAGCG